MQACLGCALTLTSGLLISAAHAQLPVLVPAGAREVLYGGGATSTDNYPPYYGTGSNGGNGFFQGAVGRDAAGDIFFLDNDGSSKAANAQVIELPVTGPVQVVVPAGDSAFNCPGTPAATLNTGGFELAVDPAGNLYIGHGYGCDIITKISRITTAGSSYGTYCTSTNTTCTAVEASVFTALLNVNDGYYFQPYDLAVDALGNAYVASSKGLLMAGPSAPGGFNLLAASTGIYGVTVDGSGNVFYADSTNAAVFEVPSTQVMNSAPVATKIGYYGTGTCPGCTSIASPASVFLDGLGNVYVAGSGGTPNLFVIPNSTSGYGLTTYTMPVTISSHYASGTKGAIDNEGNFYFYNGTSIERYSGGSISIASSSNFFPGIFAASPSFPATITYQNNSSTNPSIAFLATQTVTFNATTPVAFLNAGSLNGGTAATSYTSTTTNTCTGTITAGSSCYLNFDYAATEPGTSRGALVLYGAVGTTAGNKVLAVVSLETLGSGAAVAVDPGVRTTIGKGYQSPAGVAVDGSGNIYVADPDSNAVYKYAAGSTTTGTAVGTGLSAPNGVAVDSAGDVYIADTGNDRVVMVPNEASGLNGADQTVVTTTGYELSSPRGVALDALGNLYVADTGNARVLVVPTPVSGSVYGGVPFVLSFSANGNPSAYAFSSPYGVAVDAFQNIYVADAGANAVWLFPSGSGFTGTTTANAGPGSVVKLTNSSGTTAFNAPTGVAVDAAGTVYVADSGNAKIVRLPATAGTYSTTPPTTSTAGVDMFTGLDKPFGIATDQTGDLYATDQNAPLVTFVQRSVANGGSGVTALAFGSDPVGTTTSAKTVTLSNTGLITALAPTALPTLTSGSSPFAETATTCSTSSTVAVGSSCTFSLTFDPTATGAVTSGSGTFAFTDNALGGTAVTQGFQLTGTGVGAISTLSLTGPSAITYGDSALYTVTAKDASGNVVNVPSGTAYSLGGITCSSPCTLNAGGTFYLPNLTVTGSPYTFTATVNSIASSSATVSVAKAPLYIVSANVSRLFDVANPTFATPTYSGYANGDSASTVVGTAASSSTTATRVSPIGNYVIVPSGGSLTTFGAANYTPAYVDGDLVITGSVPQTIFFAPLPNYKSGATTYTLTAVSTSGLPITYAVTSGAATISGSTLTVTAAGAVTITATQLGNSTYAAATSVARSFTAQ
jgi:sugar lactone lactonase YvrE